MIYNKTIKKAHALQSWEYVKINVSRKSTYFSGGVCQRCYAKNVETHILYISDYC